jgi:hypothetical protein
MARYSGSIPSVFWAYQCGNIAVSTLLKLVLPLSLNGISLAYPIFTLKVVLLLWMNDYPQRNSFLGLVFFIIAVLDVISMFIFGSFSIFSVLYVRFM